jgi:hypothetical protein
MAKVRATVYDPPAAGLPYLAVLLHGDEVLAARAVPSVEAGEAFNQMMMTEFAAKVATPTSKAKK